MNSRGSTFIPIILILLITVVFALFFYAVNTQPKPATSITTNNSIHATPDAINWGTIQPGATVQQTVNITNTGTETSNPLNMTSTCTVGALIWNAEGICINAPNDWYPATFTLTTYQNATAGPFNFTITIAG